MATLMSGALLLALLTLSAHANSNLPVTNEDYDEYDPDVDPVKPKASRSPSTNGNPCDYDQCRDQEPPCEKMALTQGCLCPGQSGPYELPEAPFLRNLVQEGSKVEVQWCAPPSTVLRYRVLVAGQEAEVVGERRRRVELPGPPSNGVRVCVEAVNLVGASKVEERSCRYYEPPSDAHLPLKVGLIVGGLGLLLLLLLGALLIWRHRVRKSRDRNNRS